MRSIHVIPGGIIAGKVMRPVQRWLGQILKNQPNRLGARRDDRHDKIVLGVPRDRSTKIFAVKPGNRLRF
jgi:hypothetical protein